MQILYIGDVMSEMGMEAVETVLPDLCLELKPELVIAQAENVTEGRGISPEDFDRLRSYGVDFCTGGNWSTWREDSKGLFENPEVPIVRPANYPDMPGVTYKYAHTSLGDVLVVSLMGQIVGRDSERQIDNPLKVIDKILSDEAPEKRIATVVNLHGDFSSEKMVIGYYLDGRASLVVGDHWHIPTADADLLPKGTGHITDVGMCGSLDSSLGVKLSSVIPRWRDNYQTRNELETEGRLQFNAVYVEVDEKTGKATHINHIRRVWSKP